MTEQKLDPFPYVDEHGNRHAYRSPVLTTRLFDPRRGYSQELIDYMPTPVPWTSEGVGYGGVYRLYISGQMVAEYVPGQFWTAALQAAAQTGMEVHYIWRPFLDDLATAELDWLQLASKTRGVLTAREDHSDVRKLVLWLTGVIFGAIAIVLSQVTAFLVDEALERRKRR